MISQWSVGSSALASGNNRQFEMEAASVVYGLYISTKFMTESMAVGNVLHGAKHSSPDLAINRPEG